MLQPLSLFWVAEGGGKGGRGSAGGGRGKAAFGARNTGRAVVAVAADKHNKEVALQAKIAELERVPSAMECAADPEHVAIVRKFYGSRAHAILNILFSFDAYFAWYYPLKDSTPLFADTPIKEACALSNVCAAIDLHEMCERVSIRRHTSYLRHGAIFILQGHF